FSRLAFSADSKHVAYLVVRGSNLLAVRDGKPGRLFDQTISTHLSFSPDSKHLLFIAPFGNKRSVVIDDTPQKSYDDIKRPAYSPDGTRLAYVATLEKREFVVVNGVEKPATYRVYDF